MFLVVAFYLTVMLSFLGQMTTERPNFQSNPIFKMFGKGHRGLQTTMNVFAIATFMLAKFSAVVEESFYSNSILSPLAKDQFIPLKVKDERQHLSRHAILLDFGVFLVDSFDPRFNCRYQSYGGGTH